MQRKKPILHLFSSKDKAIAAFKLALSVENVVKSHHRDLVVETDSKILCFKNYISYENSRMSYLHHQWFDIVFYLELEEHVKNHHLSRIRWVSF